MQLHYSDSAKLVCSLLSALAEASPRGPWQPKPHTHEHTFTHVTPGDLGDTHVTADTLTHAHKLCRYKVYTHTDITGSQLSSVLTALVGIALHL